MRMRQYVSYLKYILRHKWFVLLACPLTGASIWRGLVHDLSKARPSEWVPYANTFYKPDGSRRYLPHADFDSAWNQHQKANLHHWQYWVIIEDEGGSKPLPMPDKYVREMVADWIGAGRAINGSTDPTSWYEESKDKIQLHPDTRQLVEELLAKL